MLAHTVVSPCHKQRSFPRGSSCATPSVHTAVSKCSRITPSVHTVASFGRALPSPFEAQKKAPLVPLNLLARSSLQTPEANLSSLNFWISDPGSCSSSRNSKGPIPEARFGVSTSSSCVRTPKGALLQGREQPEKPSSHIIRSRRKCVKQQATDQRVLWWVCDFPGCGFQVSAIRRSRTVAITESVICTLLIRSLGVIFLVAHW